MLIFFIENSITQIPSFFKEGFDIIQRSATINKIIYNQNTLSAEIEVVIGDLFEKDWSFSVVRRNIDRSYISDPKMSC